MRRVLVEHARNKRSWKSGGRIAREQLRPEEIEAVAAPEEILAVHEALDRLEAEDELAAQLVKLRYFAGLPIERAAEVLGISCATAYRTWTYARAWLRAALPAGRRRIILEIFETNHSSISHCLLTASLFQEPNGNVQQRPNPVPAGRGRSRA